MIMILRRMRSLALYIAEVINVEDPHDFAEAIESHDRKKWTAASDEMDSLRRNQTWVLVDKPVNRKIISCRWLYKVKLGIEGLEHERHRARLVSQGFTQKEGIDYQRFLHLLSNMFPSGCFCL